MADNNNIGKAPEALRFADDIQFDLAPTAGTDTVLGLTGQLYDVDALKAIVVARAATYRENGDAFALADELAGVEVDLQLVGNEGVHEGDEANGLSTATAARAAYENNGGWTMINAGGGRQDGHDAVLAKDGTSFDQLFVQNGAIVTVHVTFAKTVAV